MDLELTNKTVLVTGANRGTGQIIAESLAREGATVIRHSISPQVGCLQGDITSADGARSLLEQLEAHNAVIDILVNNYGTTDRHNWRDSDTDKWLQMYQINVLSAARLAQGLMQPMREKGWGRILNVGTIGSHQPNNIMPAYYAAKGALATMGVSLAKELSGSGVTVNTVSPGLIRTPELEAGYRKKAQREGWGEDWKTIERKVVETDFPNPCGRIARRDEVADLITFLCSPRADFINGQNIRIDGGAVTYV
jgi:NAD(P)-dependent dehydrogenase (short-subunit alcohol dehydrogenase family)